MNSILKKLVISMICLSMVVLPVDFGYADDGDASCEHDYISEIVSEADCMHKEVIRYTCSICGDTYTEEVGNFGGHQWNTEYTQDSPATCSEEGSESIHCSVCDAVNEETVRTIPKTDHAYGEWNVTKEATCLEVGSKERKCSVCGETENEDIPIGSHDLIRVESKEPTETEDGNIEYWYCRNCEMCFLDENGTQKISAESVILPKTETVVVDSGKCGSNVIWELYDNGTLYISGSGDMYNYSIGKSPFSSLGNSITSIVIEDGITTIGDYAFYELNGITSIELPENATSIGYGALSHCSNLKSLSMPFVGEYRYDSSLQPFIVKNEFLGYVFGVSSPFTSTIQFNDSINDSIPNNLEEVTISGSITEFKEGAFAYWSTIKTINFPSSINSIGVGTFKGCSNLTSICLPNSVSTIGDSAFYGCKSLQEIAIPSGVIKIGTNTFYDCSNLRNVTIPDSVLDIYGGAFYNCSSLVTVILPEGVRGISDRAFCNCVSMTSITIPNSTTAIGYGAFKNCSSLICIEIPESVQVIRFGGDLNSNGILKNSEGILTGCTSLKSVSFPFVGETTFNYSDSMGHNPRSKTVKNTYIGYLFGADSYTKNRDCIPASLERVSIVGQPSAISDYAFEDCSGIKELIYPDSIASIGKYAFSGCGNLTEINIPNGVSTISDGMLNGCSNLTVIEIPEGVTSIGYDAFSGCSSLEEIEIPNSIKTIDGRAFNYCIGLTSFTIPAQIENIGMGVLSGCSNLEIISVPFVGQSTINSAKINNNYIGYIFGAESPDKNKDYVPESLMTVTITGGSSIIEKNAFKDCTGIVTVTLSDNISSIGESAFSGCTSLINIPISNNLSIISENAFKDCASIENIAIPSSLQSVGGNAFENCDGINNVLISDLKTWCEVRFTNEKSNPLYYSEKLTFNGEVLTDVIVPEGTSCINNYVFYGYDKLKSITLPESVSSIGQYTFSGCSGLSSIFLPDSLTSIGVGTFSSCSGLSSISLPDSLTSIGGGAFSNCIRLENIVIPDNVESIGSSAFYNCICLEEIEIPIKVESIYSNTFSGCSNLKSIYIFQNVTTISNDSFEGINPDAIIYTNYCSVASTFFKDRGFEIVYIDYDDPNAIEIRTADQLYAIRNNLSGSYKLVQDINLTSLTAEGGKYYNNGSGWEPIGGTKGFNGYFDGNGHTIIGMKSEGGLFSKNTGIIKNLTLADGKTSASLSTDFYSGCIANINDGLIQNCVNCNDIVANKQYQAIIGGITGTNNGFIIDCENQGSVYSLVVKSNGTILDACCGGIAGINKGTVVGSNYGSVTAICNGSVYSGGIVGENTSDGSISDSLNSGSINAFLTKDENGNQYNFVYCGGVAGKSDADILSSTNRGAIYGSSCMTAYVGGICGHISNTVTTGCYNSGDVVSSSAADSYCSYAGGIVGTVEDGDSITIADSNNAGTIYATADTGNAIAGGIVGDIDEGIVTDCCNSGRVGSYTEGDSLKLSLAGGIVGLSISGSIVKSCNSGIIEAVSEYENASLLVYNGGICGQSEDQSLVSNCYSEGGLITWSTMGGIVGYNKGEINNSYSLDHFNTTGDPFLFGGIAGFNSGTIKNVYSVITLTGSATNGALLIGYNNGSVEGSLVASDICGIGNKILQGNDCGKLVKFSQMKQKSTFSGFNFNKEWDMGTGDYTLPILKEAYGGAEWQSYGRIDITGVKATLDKSSYTCNGSPINPIVTINGLTEGVDFIYESDGRIEPGTGVVTVTGIGPFYGEIEIKYTVKEGSTGWKQEDGYWYYYNKGVMVTNKWMKDSKGWCYLGADGRMVTNGWAPDSKGMCWIGSNGYMVEKTQWVKYEGDWYYIEKGYMVKSKWMKDSKGWCYVGADGKMVANGWAKDSKGYCWMDSTGHMLEKTQWVQYNGGWYYIEKGYMARSKWAKDSKGWCYLGSDGLMVTNDFVKDSKGYCWIGPDGYMLVKTGWIDVDGTDYYLKSGYKAVNTWVEDDIGWCYLGSDGLRVKNVWKKDSKGWCYLADDGHMVANGWAPDSHGMCWIGPEGYMLEVNMWIGDPGAEGSSYIIAGYRVDNQTIEIDGVEYTFDENGLLVP